MAKVKRVTVGSICKSKDDATKSYFKIRGETIENFIKALMKMDRAKGGTIRLESKADQLASLDEAVAAGKITGDSATKARERIMKMPDYVRCEASVFEELV